MKHSISTLVLILFFGIALPHLATSQQTQTQKSGVFGEAVKLFEQGKYVEAKELFDLILRQDPRHPARAYVFRCEQAIAKGVGDSKMETNLMALKTSVDFQDVPLSDALDYVRVRSTELSAGKVTPNIIFNGTKEEGAQKTVTLKLLNAPMNVILKYIAQMTRCTVKYEPYAITVTPFESVDGGGLTAPPAEKNL